MLNINDPESIRSNLDFNYDTWYLIPGFRTAVNMTGVIGSLAKTMSTQLPANVIMVDWTAWSSHNYFCIVRYLVQKVALYLAESSKKLISAGLPYDKLNYAGHSLGAHISGIASRNMANKASVCLCTDSSFSQYFSIANNDS